MPKTKRGKLTHVKWSFLTERFRGKDGKGNDWDLGDAETKKINKETKQAAWARQMQWVKVR